MIMYVKNLSPPKMRSIPKIYWYTNIPLGDKDNSGMGLSYRHARLHGWRLVATTLCLSPQSGIYDFGYRKMNCVQGRVVVDPSLEEEFAPTVEGHGEVEIFSFLFLASFF
jgi:hypothetical protein